jgi:hypothetical protein
MVVNSVLLCRNSPTIDTLNPPRYHPKLVSTAAKVMLVFHKVHMISTVDGGLQQEELLFQLGSRVGERWKTGQKESYVSAKNTHTHCVVAAQTRCSFATAWDPNTYTC